MRNWSMSIKSRLCLIILLLTAVPVSLTVYFNFSALDQALYEAQREKLRAAADFATNEIKSSIIEYARPIYILNDTRQEGLDDTGVDGLPLIRRLLKHYPDFSALAVLSPDGGIISGYGEIAQFTQNRFLPPEPHVAGTVDISSLGANPLYTVIYGIRPDGSITAGLLKPEFLRDIVRRFSFGESGHVFVTDHDGLIIAHRRNSRQFQPVITSQVVEAIRADQPFYGIYDCEENQKEVTVLALPVTYDENRPEFHWHLIAVQDAAEVFAFRDNLATTSIILLLGLFAVLLLLAVILGKVTMQPIDRIVRAAETFSHNNPRLEADITGDEVQKLTRVFNFMYSEVVHYHKLCSDLQKEIVLRNSYERKLKSARNQARMNSELKDDFIANVSHEIRTPLNAIVGYSEKLLLECADPQIVSELKTISNEAENLLLLINDILDNAKIEAGKLDLEFIPFDLHKLLRGVHESFSVQTAKKKLDFKLDIGKTVPQYIIADPVRLRQVLANLLSNAIKFTAKGEVQLKVVTHDRDDFYATTRFTVLDTGIGIPKDKISTIFEKFTQADGGTTRKYGGTGLGTTIAKRLVSLMGGSMDLRSTEGKGSTFWFDLVLNINVRPQDIEALRSQEAATRALPGQRIPARILVAEDYPVNQVLIQSQLETLGAQVTIAANGVEAVQKCQEATFDIIFMDIQMPQMSGIEATRKIRIELPAYKNTPIIALTANAHAEVRNECRGVGMNDVINKPTHVSDLHITLKRWLPALCAGAAAEPAPDTPVSSSYTATPTGFTPDAAAVEPPLNLREALSLFAGNRGLLRASIDSFCNSLSGGMLADLEAALENHEHEKAAKLAHKICGGALSVCAGRLAALARELENLINDESFVSAEMTREFLNSEAEKVLAYWQSNQEKA